KIKIVDREHGIEIVMQSCCRFIVTLRCNKKNSRPSLFQLRRKIEQVILCWPRQGKNDDRVASLNNGLRPMANFSATKGFGVNATGFFHFKCRFKGNG